MPQLRPTAYEARFDSACHMVRSTVPTGHYHCSLPPGTEAHHTRESLTYAIELLTSGSTGELERAADIIAQLLSLQDPDPTSKTYGIWPMYLEEPLGVLKVPDWNYADFIGSQMLYIFAAHAQDLPQALAQAVRDALGHAAWSIFRRNVGPHYTNISLSGAGVTAAVGERIQEPRLVAYARRRLQNMIAHYEHQGGFNEYNSPGYAMAGLHWCEWMHQFVSDATVLRHAERLRYLTWRDYADHFHPATGQLAGPQSRTYSDRLGAQIVAYLRHQTGVEVPWRGASADLAQYARNPQPELFEYVQPLPCPADLVPRFRELPAAPLQLRHTYIRREPEGTSIVGTTWFAADACLGSINRDNLWVQRRPLLAYWRTPDDDAVCLRLHFFKDGIDFASAYVSNVQVENRVLSAISLLTHKGDWHEHIDRPAEDGLFAASDFRVRYALTGRDVRAAELGDGRFELAAGPWRSVVNTTPGRFGSEPVEWRLGSEGQGEERSVFLDGICYQGRRREFRFAEMGEIVIATGIEMLTMGQIPSNAKIEVSSQTESTLHVTWDAHPDLALHAPRYAGPHRCSI